ncbi:hypothetical protein GW17_00050881 [Ensete ventricosum]|nr:hypothetical protein GW17_00050881 [Ensete ventricosum]
MSSTLPGFIGNSIAPLQTIVLPIIVSQESRSKTPMVTFMVVGLSTAYNIILRRSTLNRLRAVVSTYHHAIKFPIGAGVGEAKSDSWKSRCCYSTIVTLPTKLRVGHPTCIKTVVPSPSSDQPLVDPREVPKRPPRPEPTEQILELPLNKSLPN